MNRLTNIVYFLLSCILLISCAESPNTADEEKDESPKVATKDSTNSLKAEQIKAIFYSLPSPMELSLLFKNEGIEYNSNKLHQTDKRDLYHLAHKKALNLGVYGADLSYAGLFAQHDDAIKFFYTTQLIADELGIGPTFRKEYISRLEKNANNKDTLLQVISDFFLDNDAYLKDHKQQDISTYILVGGWFEGMYLGTSMAGESSNGDGIKDIIASQNNSVKSLIKLIDDVQDKSDLITTLDSSLNKLNNYFSESTVEQKGEAEVTESKTGELTIDPASNKIVLDSTMLQKISAEIERARSAIIE